jgi:hypothetical protein
MLLLQHAHLHRYSSKPASSVEKQKEERSKPSSAAESSNPLALTPLVARALLLAQSLIARTCTVCMERAVREQMRHVVACGM